MAGMPTPSSNRRVHVRKVLRRPASVMLPGGVERQVRTWDLGLDGMSVVSPKPIPPGTKCTVVVELPDGDAASRLSIAAKTVYCSLMGSEGVKVGLVFIGNDPEAQRLIQRFVE